MKHALIAIAMTPLALAQAADVVATKTFVYKTVGKTEIRLDVHRAAEKGNLPVVVWIHGGALVNGSRLSVPADLLDLCRTDAVALVSIDYRLAPEVKLPEIIEDVQDAFRWIRKRGAEEAGLDASRIVVTGGSAGGYLTLMTGVCVEPRPTALAAYWGYGDVDGDWYVKPSEFYRTSRPLVSREDAYKGVGSEVVTTPDAAQSKARSQYYLYLRQNGTWTKEVTGFDPAAQRDKLDRFCPVRNVTAQHPPTLLIHGDVDTDVPHQLSVDMAREFAKHKVAHELITVKGAGHGLAGGDKAAVAAARTRAIAFVRAHIKRP